MSATSTGPALLPWTEDDQANRLLADDPNALLIGFALDQQVTVQKAFAGPLVLKQRLGHLDPARIAAMPPDDLAAVFRDRPAIHRFPGAMAERVQSLCRDLAEKLRRRRLARVDRRPPAARTWPSGSARCPASAT